MPSVGDVIRFDYTLWVDAKQLPVDTSLEDRAKELNIHNHEKQYKPLTITLGQGQIIPGLEAKLLQAKEGKTMVIDLEAKDAYGERDAKQVKHVPMAMFRKEKVQPRVGMELTLEGRRAVVSRVAGGRVMVDFNHDLAGKPLRYEVTLLEVLTDADEKLNAVLGNIFPAGGYQVTSDAEAISLELPDQVKFDQQWGMNKFRVLNELRMVTDGSKDIKLVETYPSEEKLKAQAEAREAASAEEE